MIHLNVHKIVFTLFESHKYNVNNSQQQQQHRRRRYCFFYIVNSDRDPDWLRMKLMRKSRFPTKMEYERRLAALVLSVFSVLFLLLLFFNCFFLSLITDIISSFFFTMPVETQIYQYTFICALNSLLAPPVVKFRNKY